MFEHITNPRLPISTKNQSYAFSVRLCCSDGLYQQVAKNFETYSQERDSVVKPTTMIAGITNAITSKPPQDSRRPDGRCSDWHS